MLSVLTTARTARAGGGSGVGAFARSGALAALIAPVSIQPAAAIAREAPKSSGKQAAARVGVSRPTSPGPSVIKQIEQIVPLGIWLALAAALAFAGVAGASALWSGHRVRRQARLIAAVSAAALTDPLTGVLNRRGFTEAVERELARARRYDRPFVLAYVDVRGLKAVNDTAGHRAGDELLIETAALLQESARADDVVGRIGGDEMGVLLVEQGAAGASSVVARIEEKVLDRRATLGLTAPWDLTIGTAAYPDDGETFDELLRAADLRLYRQRGIALQ